MSHHVAETEANGFKSTTTPIDVQNCFKPKYPKKYPTKLINVTKKHIFFTFNFTLTPPLLTLHLERQDFYSLVSDVDQPKKILIIKFFF